jgi:pilus assembly protein CpaB
VPPVFFLKLGSNRSNELGEVQSRREKKMNKRLVSVLLFAFVISAGASLLLYRLLSSKLTTSAKPATTSVVVAARNLEVGTLIKDVDVKVADWSGAVPPHTFSKKEDVVGRGTVQNIYEGEPIVDSRLAAQGAGAGLAATIPPGMRAVAVRVNEVVGVAGFVVPGMRVDVLIAGTPPGASSGNTMSKTLLQNIEVLSAGQNIQKDNEGKPVQVQVVNLLVTPEQAEIMNLASNETRIQLILRNPLDTETTKTPGVAMTKLFTGHNPKEMEVTPRQRVVKAAPKPPAPPPPAAVAQEKPAPPVVVEVIYGAKRSETKFQPDQEKKAAEVK